jgi:hypothetical protein
MLRKPGPFVQLSATALLKAAAVTRVQTDGSFSPKNYCISRTAVIIVKPDGIRHTLCTTYFDHRNSTESEWRSVMDGIDYSIKNKATTIKLENDNLGVINSIIDKKKPPSIYSDYYFHILDMVKTLDWIAIRWIPRQLNKADKLFRI